MEETTKKLKSIVADLTDIQLYKLDDTSALWCIIDEFIDNMNEQLNIT